MNARRSPLCLTLLLSLAACAPVPKEPLAIETPLPTPAALAELNQVQRAYREGQYDEVLKLVAGSDELAAAPPAVRIEAYKLQAFSYCVRNYPQLCKDTFTRMLRIDPTFTPRTQRGRSSAMGPGIPARPRGRRAVTRGLAAGRPADAAAGPWRRRRGLLVRRKPL